MGLAHGWPGSAWVWLNLVLGGHNSDESRKLTAIHKRLNSQKTEVGYNSLLIGSGALPVIAALASRLDNTFSPLLKDSIKRWIKASEQCSVFDVMLGSAGALLACAEIESLVPGRINPNFIRRLQKSVVAEIERLLVKTLRGEGVLLGFAHGLSGLLFALEMTENVFDLPLNNSIRNRCFNTIALERFHTNPSTAVWAYSSTNEKPPLFHHGWCHGGPGIGLAFLCCFKLTNLKPYWEIGEKALEGTFRFRILNGTFCCGNVGHAQILLEAYRLTKNMIWLNKAKKVAKNILVQKPNLWMRGFHQGKLGIEYLFYRIRYPSLPLPALGLLSANDSNF